MAMIHVNRGATSLGVFSEEEVREGLRTGRFAPSDIGWREGMATWQPLSQFPELVTAAPAAPPPQAAPLAVSESVATPTGLPWITAMNAVFSTRLSRLWSWCLRNQARRSQP